MDFANCRDFFQAEKHKNLTIFPGLNHGNPVRTETHEFQVLNIIYFILEIVN